MTSNQESRLLEESADEIGRLDATCALAPASVELALLQVSSVGLSEPSLSSLAALVAAAADSLHDALLSPRLLAWRALLALEEKRVRGGATLAAARFATTVPEFATVAILSISPASPASSVSAGVSGASAVLSEQWAHRERLEAIWREPGSSRPVLERALASAAWSPNSAVGEASAALLLCAGGRCDRIRILPFVSVVGAERDDAIRAYRAGETERWTTLALRALATRARSARLAVRKVIDAREGEDERLLPLGRAAITAREALAQLRRRLATTIPSLAEDLGISRPAANDAIERLVALDLAREITGRGRDRVFAYSAAFEMAESLLDTVAT